MLLSWYKHKVFLVTIYNRERSLEFEALKEIKVLVVIWLMMLK
jgi:hypothetical protein